MVQRLALSVWRCLQRPGGDVVAGNSNYNLQFPFIGGGFMSSRPSKCPQCGSLRVAAILYGLPIFDDGLRRDLEAGRVVLGGCCVSNDSPAWRCLACGHKWGQD